MSGKGWRRVRWLNWAVAASDLAQAGVILLIAKSAKLPVTANYIGLNKSSHGLAMPGNKLLFEMPIVWLIVGFFVISAISHILMASVYRKRYQQELDRSLNRLRWISYALSGAIMIVAIAQVSGVYEIGSLAMMAGLTVILAAMGLVTELTSGKGKVNWLSYSLGVSAGLVPWLVLAFYLRFNAMQDGTASAYVYVIFISLLAIFCSFAVNMVLHFRQFGRWKSYIFTEQVYMALGLVAKSALAWQIYFGLLR